jgi:hypothetical protein
VVASLALADRIAAVVAGTLEEDILEEDILEAVVEDNHLGRDMDNRSLYPDLFPSLSMKRQLQSFPDENELRLRLTTLKELKPNCVELNMQVSTGTVGNSKPAETESMEQTIKPENQADGN